MVTTIVCRILDTAIGCLRLEGVTADAIATATIDALATTASDCEEKNIAEACFVHELVRHAVCDHTARRLHRGEAAAARPEIDAIELLKAQNEFERSIAYCFFHGATAPQVAGHLTQILVRTEPAWLSADAVMTRFVNGCRAHLERAASGQAEEAHSIH